jgi:hypothetical protein
VEYDGEATAVRVENCSYGLVQRSGTWTAQGWNGGEDDRRRKGW